jgi:phosphomethylpyrimidine synthase
MKISQEVRDFARLNPPPSAGEGDSAPAALSGERGQPDAEEGMAEMSKRFHDEGGELYVPAAE